MSVRRFAVDAAIVAALALATALYELQWHFLMPLSEEVLKRGSVLGLPDDWFQTQLTRWWIATAAGLAAMLIRGWLPLLALAGAAGMSLVHALLPDTPFMPVDLAAPIALFAVAARAGRRWLSYTAAITAVACALIPALLREPSLVAPKAWGGGAFVPPTVLAVAWLAGDRSRTRRAYLDQVTERARDLERQRDQQAELAVAAERARIARELHDAVAHGLSIIVIQAQAAAGAMERRPATARAALAAIVATGRDSLGEMRRLLGLSRPDGPELAPLPGLADLPALVRRVRATGLPVTLDQSGTPAELPTGVGLSAYRIAQEGLTNVLKHAGPRATVDVRVHYGGNAVEVSVVDTGPGAGGPPDERRGNGLRGMRERVAMLGGTFTARDRPTGGFQVTARLPLAEET